MKAIKDLGMRYPSDTATRKRRYLECQCECGNIVEIRKDQLKDTKSCGCARNEVRNDIPIGDEYGRLTILEDLGIRERKYRERFVKVKCECGEIFDVDWSSVQKGNTKSCGCLQKERASESCKKVGEGNLRHGMDGTKIYKIWSGMKQRCDNSNSMYYEYYGGRGIDICKEWSESFEVFHKWAIEKGYQEGLSIDRIDNDGNYEPSNCQWLTLADNTRKMHEDKKKRNDAHE
ncbi:HNH endonuclease [Bacillus phage Izhevsk]|uniref:Putative HNH homing endonuclease n=1 Tax=Bacillus phage Izhevsk TaxID=2724322 RepID=A0A6H0X675_9CAUD|nr:HNH endonuclease [Bacillus phage Izhevsk]QIW89742.1 putative HNH homing endonuclease [Bacillus phage Izhevsk]